ncbi:trichohyalin-like [Pyrus ussuriensis x Pyrus communis]|uniref:Trichohyalin-like n=1 Tax=Pyrus ussuriensis x Pyrus communis TaxID=2448454 RepID=A0A5N5GW01_9ROSA|nr:trichohyalin-like [Pyrus ussuriensis x Pyrus communis]
MEDDDEFGDLYTDVLRPFESSQPSSSSAPQPHRSSAAPQSFHRPIDVNVPDEEDEILFAAPHSNPSVSRPSNSQTLAPAASVPTNSARDAAPAGGSRVLEAKDVELPKVNSVDLNIGGKDLDLMDKDVNFDIEEANNGADAMGLDPVIPGLSDTFTVTGAAVNIGNPEGSRRDGERGEDDWDSDDSDDDLQIVLNDNNHGPMAMERGGMGGEDEDDDDGLVIVADGEPNQPMDDQEWGEESTQTVEGERKEMGEAGKTGAGSVVVPPKVGYSSHGYHPFHSQFKYVRPGAVPMPGPTTSGPGGVPGQVRPLLNMGPVPGRGRGDWRPTGMRDGTPLQKNFHSGFGTPGWGNNTGGRGFGGGLEFTLPSHKTIFDVDIDGFEEKPWKYPGVDTSDFFNFGLNEDSWKDYCKQLELLRLESTMQSKIRVYESGRTEQEYDPDLPPELAAATGIHELPPENANPGKSDVVQSDLVKGTARLRPPIPTGRAIQVEGGFGERLPSIDTRPPRVRDSDAIIEIVLQDSLDDASSAGNGIPDGAENDHPREGFGRGEGHLAQVESEYFDGLPQAYNDRKRELVGRKMPFHDDIPEEKGNLPFPPDVPVPYTGSGGETPSYQERKTQLRARDGSPHVAPSQNTRDKNYLENQKEESIESVDGKRSPGTSSPVTNRAARESSAEYRDSDQDEPVLADGGSEMGKEETATVAENDALQDGPPKHKKLVSRVEHSADEELDDGEDLKAARSSDNSKARSGSSRDYQKWRDGVEEEVIQGRSMHMGGIKRHLDENEQGFQRKNRDGRQEPDRSHVVVKGREGSYPYRDWDPSSAHQLQLKNDGLHRRKERENLDGAWQQREDDPYSRRIRPEETRKREHGDEMGSRHRSKGRESDRSDKDEHLQSRKQLDNGSYRAYHDKDVGSRPREREGSLKGRYEHVEDYHGKRRKDEEYIKRDHIDKEDFLHGHRDNTTRRKRERDEILDPRKRDEQQRVRENVDDLHSVRHKDDSWSQRERGDRQREREEWPRVKQSHEENIPKRERDEGRVAIRGGRGAEDKAWVGHTRAKEENKGSDKEHQYKETVRHSEPSKRRDRVEEESSHHRGRDDVHGRGNQITNDQKRSGKERSSTRNERADNQKVHDRKHKESSRKTKESVIANNSITSKKRQEDQSGQNKEMGLKGTHVQGTGEEIPQQRHSSKRHKEDASSDDEQQDSKKGRSKLERWTSHKERDFGISNKSSLKLKELDRINNRGSSDNSRVPEESSKPVEAVDNQQSMAEEKDASDQDIKDSDTKPLDADAKPLEERHLDTVEKLKKRSERFKLPMPSEKEPVAIKKVENDVPPSTNSETQTQTQTPVESEIKPERPARKRRWISN